MQWFRRRLLKITLGCLTLLVVGIVSVVLIIVVGKDSAQQKQFQQLATLDEQFSVNRNPIPVDATGETLLPQKVEGFTRSDVYRYTESCYLWHFQGISLCFSAIYTNSAITNRRQSTLWADVWLKTTQGPQMIGDIVGFYPCGAELGGEISESSHPYGYLTCFGYFIGEPSLNGIIWQNGDWFIGIRGQYEAISQFVAAYPY